MKREGFPRGKRLISSRDFQTVFRLGVNINAHPALHGRVLARPENVVSRLGLVVSRKIGNAVIRNRIKRRLREVFRKNEGNLPECMDIVLVAKPGIHRYSYRELEHLLVTRIMMTSQKGHQRAKDQERKPT